MARSIKVVHQNHSQKFPIQKTKVTTFATHGYPTDLHDNELSVSMKLDSGRYLLKVNQMNFSNTPSTFIINITKQSLQRNEVFR